MFSCQSALRYVWWLCVCVLFDRLRGSIRRECSGRIAPPSLRHICDHNDVCAFVVATHNATHSIEHETNGRGSHTHSKLVCVGNAATRIKRRPFRLECTKTNDDRVAIRLKGWRGEIEYAFYIRWDYRCNGKGREHVQCAWYILLCVRVNDHGLRRMISMVEKGTSFFDFNTMAIKWLLNVRKWVFKYIFFWLLLSSREAYEFT